MTTVGTPSFTLQGNPVKVLSSVTIADADSDDMSGAEVKLTTLSQDGDVLSYTAPQGNPITGVWNATTKTLTLTGAATKAQYEEALKAVTFSATQGALLVRGVEVWVTDDTQTKSLTAGVALINVFNPFAPAIGTLGTPTFTLEGDPVKVLSSVTITDVDSDTMSSAQVKLTTLSQDGDTLSYTAPQDNPITGVWDATTKTLTLSGTGTIDQYEAALKAVTFSATQGALLVRGVEVWVTDSTHMTSLLPGVALINVSAAPLIPLVSTLGAPNYVIGKDPVKLLTSVTIADLDSENMSGAVVKINTLGQTGDVLGYTAPQGNPVTGVWDASTKTLTLSGTATKAQYEEALKAVTFSATQGAALVRGFLISVTDSTGLSSGWSGVATATVSTPLPPAIGTLGTPTFTIDGDPVTVLASVTITDGDSTTLSGATVKINTLGQTGDVLGYTAPQDNPITATWDASSKTLTLSGTGTIDQYEAALKAVTFSATQGAGLIRGLLINVTDETGVQSIGPGIATVIVNAAALIPLVSTLGAPNYVIGKDPVTLLASVTITDLDSDDMSGAVVKINTLGQTGDVLGYTAPQGNPVTGVWDASTKTLTLSGTATKAQYEEALKAVTFSATQGAALVRGFLISVTDSTGLSSGWSGAATATVANPAAPILAAAGIGNYIIGKSGSTIFSSVSITDSDSQTLSGAVLKIATLGQSGDALNYAGLQGNPITASWDAASKTLTLTGTATADQYEDAIKAVTFTGTQGAGLVRGISVVVTDDLNVSSATGFATVNVANPAAPAIATLGAPTFTIDGSPVTVLASVTITDADSTTLSGASVKINTLGQSGDVLAYTGSQFTATYDVSTKTLTLSGTGSINDYEAALKLVTFTATQGAALVRGLLINVTDDMGVQSLTPGIATINVNAAPLIPLVSTLGAPNYIIGKNPVKLLASVTITDGDSDNLSGAVVKINTLGQTGDVLGYVAPQGNPVTATWDASSKTLTLSGTATKAQYEEALKAVTFSATQGAALVRGFLISVTDSTGLSSGWSGAATATVANPAAPAVATLGASTFTLEGDSVTVLASVTITDIDSTDLSGATVKINTLGQSGDVLGYAGLQNNPITATWDASSRTLTLSGTATIDQYVAALKAVTFTGTQGAGLVRGLLINVTDDTGVQSLTPGAATINVNAAPLIPLVSTLGAPNYTLTKSPVQLLSSVTVTDGDSANMSGAVVKINTLGQSGDVLGYTAPQGNPITATWDASSKTLTLTGTATKAQYEAALKAVTFSATQGVGLVRGFLISVTDSTGLSSGWSGAATATVSNPIAPTLAVAGVSTYVIGKVGTTIMPSLSISDSDSSVLTGAKVTIATLAQSGDVLSYAGIGGNPITATWDAGSKTLSLTGTATLDQYKAALQAITFTATGNAGLVRGVSVVVTDDSNLNSATGLVTVNVNNPVASAIAVLTGPTGNNNGSTKTKLFSSATITDADSTVLTGATVYISVSAYSNDKLYFDGIAGIPVTGSYNSSTKTLTLTGTATLAQYEQVIEAVTWTSNQGWGIVRSFQVRVIDDSGLTSPFSFVSIAPY